MLEILRDKNNESHYFVVIISINSLMVALCYKHPKYPVGGFLNSVSSCMDRFHGSRIVVMGDFNVDILKNAHGVQEFFTTRGFENKLKENDVTTEYGTQIDACFSNFQETTAFVHETYYSYHKGICVTWM